MIHVMGALKMNFFSLITIVMAAINANIGGMNITSYNAESTGEKVSFLIIMVTIMNLVRRGNETIIDITVSVPLAGAIDQLWICYVMSQIPRTKEIWVGGEVHMNEAHPVKFHG